MITRPLELESRMSPPPRDLDFVAWVNVGVIALFFTLFGSGFVLAPGLLMGARNEGFQLPVAGGTQYASTASVVVSYRKDDVILFEGAIIKLPELRLRLEAYAKKHPGEVLLLLADKHVSTQAVFDLSVMAQSAGFAYVLMAGENPPAPTSGLK
jgi:biopolymer transport protein ExbD